MKKKKNKEDFLRFMQTLQPPQVENPSSSSPGYSFVDQSQSNPFNATNPSPNKSSKSPQMDLGSIMTLISNMDDSDEEENEEELLQRKFENDFCNHWRDFCDVELKKELLETLKSIQSFCIAGSEYFLEKDSDTEKKNK